MVFVTVCQDDRRQVISIFLEKVEIRYRNINTIRRFFGKAHTGIDDDHLVAVADSHAIHPEFADTAKRDYFNSFSHYELVSITHGNARFRGGNGPPRGRGPKEIPRSMKPPVHPARLLPDSDPVRDQL